MTNRNLFGMPRARRYEKSLRNVHHVHPTFAFIGLSGEHCVFRFFTTFTSFITFTLFISFTTFTFQQLTIAATRSRHYRHY